MSLNITYLSRTTIYQCGDFRLTDSTGREIDVWAQKQISASRFRWTALIAFCGLAQTHPRKQEWVADWMAERVKEITMDARLIELAEALCSADDWLRRFPRTPIRRLSFSVAGFEGIRPFFTLISNFESLHRPSKLGGVGVAERLSAETIRPSKPTVRLAGRPDAVRRKDRWLILGAARAGAPHDRMHRVLSQVNRRASSRDTTISRASHVSHVTVTGEWGSQVDGWPEDRDYIPAFVDLYGLRLRPAMDENGNPKPIQLVGMSRAGYSPSLEYFERTLREKPEDAETLNNYGVWYAEAKGDDDSAERLYLRAIRSNPEHALAHSNLGGLLWRRRDLDGAEREYELALKANPDELNVLVNYATFMALARHDRAAATRLFEKALARERNAFALSRYAMACDELGELDSAEELFSEALSLEPNDPWANGRSGYFLWRRRSDNTRAEPYIRKAVADNGRDLVSLLVAADFEMNVTGDHAAARRLTRRALRVAPQSADALAAHASAMRHTGADLDRVERILHQALAVDPAHTNANAALHELRSLRGSAS